MNPIDALQQDWHLYYDGSWMEHTTKGPGQVVVNGHELYFYTYPDDMPEAAPKKVTPKELHYWWPRPGSFNTPNGAVHVTRMATRSMRKSAHGEHYNCSWVGANYHNHPDKGQIMLWMRRGPNPVDVRFARQALAAGMTDSAAVASDLILATTPKANMLSVVYRGIAVGKLKGDIFMPYYKTAPITRRCTQRLMEEGII